MINKSAILQTISPSFAAQNPPPLAQGRLDFGGNLQRAGLPLLGEAYSGVKCCLLWSRAAHLRESFSKFSTHSFSKKFPAYISKQFSTSYAIKNPLYIYISTDFSTGCGLLLWKNNFPNKCSCFVQIVQACCSI